MFLGVPLVYRAVHAKVFGEKLKTELVKVSTGSQKLLSASHQNTFCALFINEVVLPKIFEEKLKFTY